MSRVPALAGHSLLDRNTVRIFAVWRLPLCIQLVHL